MMFNPFRKNEPKHVGYFEESGKHSSANRFWTTLHEVANENPFNGEDVKQLNPHVWSEDVLITLMLRSDVVRAILDAHGIDEFHIRESVRKRFNVKK